MSLKQQQRSIGTPKMYLTDQKLHEPQTIFLGISISFAYLTDQKLHEPQTT